MPGKSEMVDRVVMDVDGVTKRQASEIFDAIFGCITEELTRGERVQIPGFGSFSISERAAREGRNPATGERIHIAASKNVRFKAGKDLRDSVND